MRAVQRTSKWCVVYILVIHCFWMVYREISHEGFAFLSIHMDFEGDSRYTTRRHLIVMFFFFKYTCWDWDSLKKSMINHRSEPCFSSVKNNTSNLLWRFFFFFFFNESLEVHWSATSPLESFFDSPQLSDSFFRYVPFFPSFNCKTQLM